MGKNRFDETPLQEEIFIEGMEELQTNFDLKEFTAKRAELYYRKFKEEALTNWMFTRIKEHILEGEQYFPVISVFYSYLEDIYEERAAIKLYKERVNDRDKN